MSLVTEYPLWFVIFCMALGAVYAGVLYFRNRKLDEMPRTLLPVLAFFRFAAVSLLAFFLLNPLLESLTREVEKPIVVIAQDRSQSLVGGADSAFYTGALAEQLQQLETTLGSEYEVATFNVGESVVPGYDFSYSGRQTDLSQVFEEIATRYSNRNLGAVVLASDGIYNKGISPLYASAKLEAPLFTVALGDTTVKKDLVLNRVAHNRLAYLGNEFPLEIVVEARQLKGARAKLEVRKGGALLFTKEVDITSPSFVTTVPVLLEATETGIQAYDVELLPLDNESTAANNRQRIYVDVLDARQKILLLAHAPHPDVAAIRQAIESNDNYEITVALAQKYTGTFDAWNLVVLHQVPANGNSYGTLLGNIKKAQVPMLHVLGNATNIGQFNNSGAGLRITENRNNQNEAIPGFNNDFTLFGISDRAINFLKRLPPAAVPFGNYRKGTNAEVLLTQRIGMVQTELPLVMFTSDGDAKTGIIAGEGLWRWRLADFAEHGSHAIFNELIGKTIQYLSVKDDKSRFRVSAASSFLENESIVFDAEVYNQSYELITEPEVSLEITNEEGATYNFAFNRTARQYYLNAGVLPPGSYRYTGKTTVGDKVLTASGAFTVNPIHVELVNTVANHQLLYNLAQRHGGTMVYPNQLVELPDMLKAREDLVSVSYTQTNLEELIHKKWIFYLILALLALEWFMRKRNGAY